MEQSLTSNPATPLSSNLAERLPANSLLSYKTKSQDGDEGQKIIIFGAPGTGKTVYAGGAADKFEVLWFDLENGKDSLLTNLSDEQLANITYVPISDTTDAPVAAVTLSKLFEHRRGRICYKHSEFNCPLCGKNSIELNLDDWTPDKGRVVVIDSATQFSWSAFFRAMFQLKKDLSDGDSTSFDIWRIQGAYITKLFSAIQASNNHVITIAHEHDVQYPDKSVRIVPSVGTKTQKMEFAKFFGHKLRASIKMGKYVMSSKIKAGANFEVGSRWNIDAEKAGVTICDFLTMGGKPMQQRKPEPVEQVQAEPSEQEQVDTSTGEVTVAAPAAKPKFQLNMGKNT